MGIGIAILVLQMINNPLTKKLEGYTLVLASGSPRRKDFFENLGIPFTIKVKNVKEDYPAHLQGAQIAEYIAQTKANAFKNQLKANEIVITADTVVWCNGESLAKATNKAQALEMLKKLSGQWHQVITAVCLFSKMQKNVFSATTKVKFKKLTNAEMHYYIDTYHPYDKAGAYGIQEWLGSVAIEAIEGSYNNVVGLPTHLVYKALMQWQV